MADPRTFWLGQARFLAVRHNAARCLDLFLPTLVGLSAIGSAALLLLHQWRAPTHAVWWAIIAAAFIGAVACVLIARRKFFSTPDALVRLDECGHLHNRLTSAHHGVGPWPPAVAIRDAAKWRWPRIAAFAGLSALLILGGAWLQLPELKTRDLPAEQPIGWSQMDSWLQTLQDSKLVEPEALDKLQSELNDVRSQRPEKWYEQSSLEAGDSLRQQTEAALRGLQHDLQKAEAAVSGGASGKETPEELKQMQASLPEAVKGLAMGNLPLNHDLLKQLKDYEPGSTAQLTAEERKKLEERLQEGKQVCEKCLGPGEIKKDEKQARSGGEGGGGETAPLALTDENTDLHSKATEGVANEDLSRALPGEVLEVTPTAPEVKPKASDGAIDGGSIQSKGQGGEAVWRDSVTPRERDLLQRFFK